ncbi:MAG: hypothetical protein C4538_05645 [Nitrospiraceae bacterium]|nr:MAG: hypothetical protein C4538_05645 [Nitrospiraceae bacterium]
MMNEKLLFVTKGGEDCDNGFTYILELAKTLKSGIAALIIYSKKMAETYEDVMAAVAFAEAGDLNSVRELMQSQEKELKKTAQKKINEMNEKCRENSVPFTFHIAFEDTITATKDFLKHRPEIDMVLLSPNLSVSKKRIDLKRFLKNITKPVVAISGPAEANA